MQRISLLVLASVGLWAQSASPTGPVPPPEVEKAVRARTIEFCELHKEGKFRQAEEMVAEDTKDYFYNSGKPHYVSYEIQSITYNEDFTKATAMVLCEQYLPALGFQGKTVKLHTPFHWKIENGQWMWYMSNEALMSTPFGKLPATSRPAAAATAHAAGPQRPPVISTSVEQFFSMIKADKSSLDLKPGASGEVAISNGTPGVVILVITQQIPGVEAKLEGATIPSGGKAVLTVHAGAQAASGDIRVQVKPIGPPIAIRVSVR